VDRRLLAASIALALLVFAASVAAQAPAAEYFLDLVSYLHSPRPEAAASARVLLPGRIIDFDADPPAPISLDLTLVTLEGRQFEWGDEFIYEILVKNAGPEPVAIPWTPDPLLLPEQERSAGASISLEISNRDRSERLGLALQPLFGSASVSGTLQTLEPGQSARIRVRGAFSSTSPQAVADFLQDESPMDVAVKARFDLIEQGVLLTSANSIDATLSYRAQ
jgi:hypothetical protein